MVSSPNYWLDTTNAGAPGASAPSLNSVSRSGSIAPLTAPDVFYGTYSSGWNNNNPTAVNSTLTLTIGSPIQGNPGSDGGNNRNSSKGGGAEGAGSITIYKIYEYPAK